MKFPTNDVRSAFTYSWDQGYFVYWKGVCIEHYDEIESEKSINNLKRLADRCHNLQFLGVPVNGTTAIWSQDWFKGVNHLAGTPVMNLMGLTPSLYERGEESLVVKSGKYNWEYDHIVLKDQHGEIRVFQSLHEFAADQGVEVMELDSSYHTAKAAGFSLANCGQREDLGTCYAEGPEVADWLNSRLADKLNEVLENIRDSIAYRNMAISICEAA